MNIDWGRTIGLIGTMVMTVWAWIKAHRKDIMEMVAMIIKKVEAATADGDFTKEEKLSIAKEIYDTKLYPMLPFYLKPFSPFIWKEIVKLIDRICAKAKEINVPAPVK